MDLGGSMRIVGTATALSIAIGMVWIQSLGPASAEMQARRAYDFVDSVGVNTHFGWSDTVYNSEYDRLKAALADLGIKHIRQNTNSPLGIRRVQDLNGTLGIRSLMLVDNFKTKDFWSRELDAASVADQINTAMDKVGANALSGIEGPNEYNATLKRAGNADWAQDLRTFTAAIHQA